MNTLAGAKRAPSLARVTHTRMRGLPAGHSGISSSSQRHLAPFANPVPAALLKNRVFPPTQRGRMAGQDGQRGHAWHARVPSHTPLHFRWAHTLAVSRHIWRFVTLSDARQRASQSVGDWRFKASLRGGRLPNSYTHDPGADYQVAGADFQVAGAISTFGGDFIVSVQNPPFPYYLEVQRGNPGTVKAASWI